MFVALLLTYINKSGILFVIKVNCTITANLEPGEFTNSETGEIIKWGDRSEAYVLFPGEQFHQKILVKGRFSLGEGVLNISFSSKKDKPVIVIGAFELIKK